MSLSCLIQPNFFSGAIVSKSHCHLQQFRLTSKTGAEICNVRARPWSMQYFTGLWGSNPLDAMGMQSVDFFSTVSTAIISTRHKKSSRGVAIAMSESSFSGFTVKSIKVILLAQKEAKRLGQSYVGPTEILLGLIGEGTEIAARVLNSLGINLNAARKHVKKHSARGFVFQEVEVVPFSILAMRALDFAAEEACCLFHNSVKTEHLFLGLLRIEHWKVKDVLESLGLDPCKIRKKVFQALAEEGIEVSGKAPVEGQNDSNKIKLAKECVKIQAEELTELGSSISKRIAGSSGPVVMRTDTIKAIGNCPAQVNDLNDCLIGSSLNNHLMPYDRINTVYGFAYRGHYRSQLYFYFERETIFKLLSLLPGRVSYTEGVPLSEIIHCCPYIKIIFDEINEFFPADLEEIADFLDCISSKDLIWNFFYDIYEDSSLKCGLRLWSGGDYPDDVFFVSYIIERKIDSGGYSFAEYLVHVHRRQPSKNEKDCITRGHLGFDYHYGGNCRRRRPLHTIYRRIRFHACLPKEGHCLSHLAWELWQSFKLIW